MKTLNGCIFLFSPNWRIGLRKRGIVFDLMSLRLKFMYKSKTHFVYKSVIQSLLIELEFFTFYDEYFSNYRFLSTQGLIAVNDTNSEPFCHLVDWIETI